MTYAIETIEEPSETELRRLVTNLVAWNLTAAPPEEHRRLAVFAHAESELAGGAAGYTHWQWLFVSHLWVADEHRGGGLGTTLMRDIEAAAMSRGCDNAHLDTYDFQALGFYRGIGYSEFAELADYPPGHTRHFLRKSLR